MAGSRKSVRREGSLESLVAQIRRVNPTGRGRRSVEEVARYGEKARLQSLLIENHPEEVAVTLHDDMPGIVGLSVRRLHITAGHAVVENLSTRARHIIEQKIHHAGYDLDVLPFHRSRKTNEATSFVQRAERYVAEYDFECALETLVEGIHDSANDRHERIRGSLLMLEIYVDHLADDEAALGMEPILEQMGQVEQLEQTEQMDRLSMRAHELLGVAASRSDDWPKALHHLSKSYGERVGAEIAGIATKAMNARTWTPARKAWQLLNVHLSTADAPLVGSLEATRNMLKDQFVRIAHDASETQIRSDAELERLVREFAPHHPYLEERRSLERKIRNETAARLTMQKAREARRLGHLDELAVLLDAIAPDGLSDAELADLAAWREWLEEQRTNVQINRVMHFFGSGDFDAAARAYLGLSPLARTLWSTRERDPWFTVIDQLNELLSDRKNATIVLRAAVAWASARKLRDPRKAWSMLAPYKAFLSQLETCAPSLIELRQAAEAADVAMPAESRVRRSDDENSVQCNDVYALTSDVELGKTGLTVAGHALRLGTESYVVTLGRHMRRQTLLLSFWPCRSGAVRHWEFLPSSPSAPKCIAIHHGQLVWLGKSGGLWRATFGDNPSVRCLHPDLPLSLSDESRLIFLDAEYCAVNGLASETAASWWILDLVSGSRRLEVSHAGLYEVATAEGTTWIRTRGLCVDVLDAMGKSKDHFEIPKRLSPIAFVAVPGLSRPVVLSNAVVRSCVMACWQPQPRFFRGFELFDTVDHGEFVDACGIAARGLFVLTRRRDGATFLHEAKLEKGNLRAGRIRRVDREDMMLVRDGSDKRAWIVGFGSGTMLEIMDLVAYFDQGLD